MKQKKEILFATSDIEANKWIELTMIGLYNGKEYKVFNSIDKYLSYLMKGKTFNGYRIYFHNGGRYDFLFLVEKLFELGEVKLLNKNSGILLVEFKYGNNKIKFCDSYPILPSSLEKLIKVYNIKEKKIKIDFTKNYTYKNKRLHEHLKNDCISLYKIIEQFIKDNGFISLTIASHSLNIFMSKYFNGQIWDCSDKFDNYFRTNYYRGGRVEIYKHYGKNLYYYDVNSLYPFVMLKNEMPCGYPIRTKKYQIDKVGFYKIQLKNKFHSHISILAKRKKSNIYYVNGNKGNIFYLCSCEIEYLIEHKIKFDVLDGYYFTNTIDLFTNYVNDFYKIKKETKNETERYFAKLMLNSLYGKFGQKLYGENIEQAKGYEGEIIFDAYNSLVLVERKRNVKIKGVYISAYITALARVHHLRLMEEIGFENIWYCDTDSIITNKKISTSTEIGKLKLEDKIKEIYILNPKTYAYKDFAGNEIVKNKGFRAGFTFNQFKDLLLNEKTLEQKQLRILGYKESFRRKNGIVNDKGQNLKTVYQTKKLSFNYTKREIITSKKYIYETIPFNFEAKELA